MCNLYSLGKRGPDAIRAHFAAGHDEPGNMEPRPAIFLTTLAPVVLMMDGACTLTMKSWGMPSPGFVFESKKVDPGVTNVRNVATPHWRRWLELESCCLVPLTAFSEFDKATRQDVWFALGEDRPLACFAGIDTNGWTSTRKLKDDQTTDNLYAFLNLMPNAEVAPIHPRLCR